MPSRRRCAVRDGEPGASLSLTCSDWDSDDDGVRNADDACPLVPGNGLDGCAAACFWNDEFEAHPICYNAVCDRYLTGRWLAHLGTWLLTALKNPSEGVDNSIEAFIESWSVHNEGGDWQVSRRIDTPISVGTFPPETVRYSPAGSDPSTASEVEFTIGTNIHATLRRCNQ